MMNHNIILLNAMSDIDEQVIDKNTEERCRRMRRGNKRPGGWVKWVAIAACICLILPLGIFLFGRLGQEQKQIPVYQGMTISSAAIDTAGAGSYATGGYRLTSLSSLSGLSASSRPTLVPLVGEGQGMEPGREPAPGHDEWQGDRPPAGEADGDRRPAPETRPMEEIVDDPADLSGETATGESETDSLTVEGSERDIYYAKSGEDIYITVHISNPDNYEILSFTLNGKTYASYMFEPGSDMEHLILKYNVGDVEGIVEYTIDAVKYVDGTQIKDVLMEGDQTVRAGVYSDKQPTAAIQNEVVGINALSFDVTVTDPLALISQSGGLLYAVMTDGANILSSHPLTVGEPTTVTFDELTTGGYYDYAIVAYYDSLDGSGMNTYILAEMSGYTQSIVGFEQVEIAQESVDFGLVWNETHTDRVLTSATLYLGETAVQELDPTATTITGLLSNTTYCLSVTYRNGDVTETAELTFTTEAKTIPTLSVTAGDVTQSSLSFGIELTDPDRVGALTSVELLHGDDEPVAAEDLTKRAFESLLSDNTYTVRVTATYDLNDGTGEHTLTETWTTKTEAKAAPVVSLQNAASTRYTVEGDYLVTDIDKTLANYTLTLHKADDKIATGTPDEHGHFSFDGLDYYTTYTVRVSYTYDLCDGKGVQTATVSQDVLTQPYIDVTSCTVRNTSAVSDGDTIYLQAELDNPLGAKVTEVCVSGRYYAVTGSSTSTRIFVEIVNDGQFAGGDTELTIEGFKLKLDGKEWEAQPDTACSDSAFINGKLEVLSFYMAELVDGEYMPIYAVASDMTPYLMLSLNNPTDYTIDSIEISCNYAAKLVAATSLIRVDRDLYAAPLTDELDWWEEEIGYNGWGGNHNTSYTLTSLHYSNEYLQKDTTPDKTAQTEIIVTWFDSSEIHYISTPDDLRNIDATHSYRYELTNDIDLSGIEWSPVNFWGVFDGNGFSIRNMTYVGTMKGGGNFGLFGEQTNGHIKDLTLENALVIIESDGNVCYGGIVGAPGGHIILLENCIVDEDSSVQVTAPNAHVGGLSPCADRAINCINYSTISVTTSDGTVGGICSDFFGIMTGCSNYGDIIVSASHIYGGGLVGWASGGSITACINYGNIEAHRSANNGNLSVGGIAGVNTANIIRCENHGDITTTGASAGGLVSLDSSTNHTISNCINTGNVESDLRASGLVAEYSGNIQNSLNSGHIHGLWSSGLAGFSPLSVANCLNVGDITHVSESLSYGNGSSCGTIEADDAIDIIQNSYALDLYSSTQGEVVTLEQLSDPSFYTDVLGWDASIWCFDDLDPANGKYPTLR